MTTPRPRRAAEAPTEGGSDRTGVRTHSRITDRRKSNTWMKVGMVLFFVGVVAIVADVALFASGVRPLPMWINLTALLAPIGFAVGLVGTVVETRAATAAKRAADTPTGAESAAPSATAET